MPVLEETPAPTEVALPSEPASPSPAVEPAPLPEKLPVPEPEPSLPANVEPPKQAEVPPKLMDEIAQIDPSKIDPQTLTASEVVALTQAAIETLAVAEPSSPEYQMALDQLMIVAESDDPELPSELANIPLVGSVASAVLDAFNNIGNIGADMSPKQRKQAKKQVLVSIAVGQAVMSAGLVSAVGYRKEV
jgi:hypothetical protein